MDNSAPQTRTDRSEILKKRQPPQTLMVGVKKYPTKSMGDRSHTPQQFRCVFACRLHRSHDCPGSHRASSRRCPSVKLPKAQAIFQFSFFGRRMKVRFRKRWAQKLSIFSARFETPCNQRLYYRTISAGETYTFRRHDGLSASILKCHPLDEGALHPPASLSFFLRSL